MSTRGTTEVQPNNHGCVLNPKIMQGLKICGIVTGVALAIISILALIGHLSPSGALDMFGNAFGAYGGYLLCATGILLTIFCVCSLLSDKRRERERLNNNVTEPSTQMSKKIEELTSQLKEAKETILLLESLRVQTSENAVEKPSTEEIEAIKTKLSSLEKENEQLKTQIIANRQQENINTLYALALNDQK